MNRRGFLAGAFAAMAIDLGAPRRAYSFLWAPAPRRFLVIIGTGQHVELEEIEQNGRVRLAPGEPSLKVARTSFPGGEHFEIRARRGFEIGDEVSVQFANAWAEGPGAWVLPEGTRVDRIEVP